jgi:hypothetical protein
MKPHIYTSNESHMSELVMYFFVQPTTLISSSKRLGSATLVDLLRSGNGLLAEATHATFESITQPLAGGVAPLNSRLVIPTARSQAVITEVAGASSTLAAKTAVARGLELILARGVDVSLLVLHITLKGVRGLALALEVIGVVALKPVSDYQF